MGVLEARLKAHGIHCWRDEWEMLAGDDVVTSLREGIEASSIVIVFIGRNSLGPWQKREIVSAKMEQRLRETKRLIPVFFPGPSKEEREKLADFLQTPLGIVFSHLDEKAPFEKLLKKLSAAEPGKALLPCEGGAPPWMELQNPYKGLNKFLEGDCQHFFGREAATAALMENVAKALSAPEKARLFVLTGASGCGKSSLARAGLMAGLKAKWGDKWRYATVDHPGNNPLNELATKLSGETRRSFEAELHADTRALDSKMSQSVPDGSDGKFVLLVDQFEEVFTLCESADRCRAFIANLLFAASRDNGKGIVILTLRSEFWQSFMDAVEEEKKACNGKASLFKESSIKPVAPMDRSELRQAIEAPAQQMGVGYEAALLEKLLEDAGTAQKDKDVREGILPLLQVALEELWQFRNPHHISYGAYQETGGIRGALEKRANDIYGSFDEAQRRIAQHIFLNLLRINPDAPETRQRVGADEFSVNGHDKKEVAKVVESLVDGRLLVSDKGEVEIIHETLISHWGILRDWVENSRESLKRRQQMEDRAKLWQNGDGDLLTGKALDAALKWVEEDDKSPVPLGLSEDAKKFLEASKTQQDKSDQHARQQRAAAEAQRLASAALAEQNKKERVDLSLLLAMASIQEMEATQNPALAESERVLLTAFRSHPQLDSYLYGHTDVVNSLAFSPDGSVLASASHDKTIILWNLQQRQALATLRGHEGEVEHLSFSPDGSLLASASWDKTVILWDVKKQQALATLHEHDDWIEHLSFSPDGSLLASASWDKTIILWNVKQQKALATLRGRKGNVEHLSFNPDGSLWAAASHDKTVILWDVEKQQKLATLGKHAAGVNHLSFSPDGSVLASASNDKTVILWSVKQQQKLAILRGHEGGIKHLSFSPDGSLLASASNDKTVILWDVKQQQKLATLRGHDAGVQHLSFSSDGSLLASASFDRKIILWDVKQWQVLATLRGHDHLVRHLSFNPDGNLLASASFDKTIILWDVKRQQALTTLRGHEGWVHHLSFSPDGSLLASTVLDKTIGLYNLKQQQKLTILRGHEGWVHHLSFSPDGRVLASASADKTVILWNMEQQQALATLRGHDAVVRHLSFSPDGSLLASASHDKTVILWDVKQQNKWAVLAGHDAVVRRLSFSPDGRVLASASDDKTVILWSVKRQQVLATLPGHDDVVRHLSFSPDGSLLTSASNDKTVILWNVEKQQALATLRGHEGWVGHLSLSPDGSVLALTGLDKTISLYNLKQQQKLATLHGHDDGWVTHLSFSPDGKLLASASDDQTVVLWNVKQRQALATFRGHASEIHRLSFSPDGKLLASASKDSTVILWDVSPPSWRERARRIVNRNMTLEEWRTHMGERPYRKIFEDLPGPSD